MYSCISSLALSLPIADAALLRAPPRMAPVLPFSFADTRLKRDCTACSVEDASTSADMSTAQSSSVVVCPPVCSMINAAFL